MAATNPTREGRRKRADFHFQRAFTIIELVVVITIVGILASLAGPSFRDFLIQQRIRTEAYELMSDLTFARSEAVKRNAAVTVAKKGSWDAGWTVKDAASNVLRDHSSGSGTVTIAMASDSITFSLNGRASPAASFSIDDAGGKASIAPRYICVDQSGRPRSSSSSCA